MEISSLVLLLLHFSHSFAAPTESPFTFYNMLTPAAGPCDLCQGPDGAEWGQDQLVDKIFRIDPNTSVVTEYDIPYTLAPISDSALPRVLGRTALSCAIRPGRDGNIYAANGLRNQLVRVNITTKEVDVFTPPLPSTPAGDLQPFNDLNSGPDGIFFTQTTANLIGYFKFATEEFENFLIPTLNALPLGMFYASDGGAWFTEFGAQKIGRLNVTTGTFEEYDLPLSLAGPAVIRVETQNRYIWFTAFVGNGIGRLDMQTGEVVAFTNPSPASFPAEDTLDGQGNIWFSTATQNVLNKLVPSTGQISQVVEPGTVTVAPVSVPLYFTIAINYGPGDAIWFTEELMNRVGRYALS